MKFEIREEFYINDKKTKIISGALHYFRIFPEQWEHSLYNLKAMGCNTVETYIPWNLHEPKKGHFNFDHLADIERFIELATDLDLYIILRPTPYICAEWEFGGLPAWLIKDKNLRVRSQNANFLKHVDEYFSVLLPKLTPYQFTQGGKVLMMQVENEYGSFGEDHEYLRQLVDIMVKYGVDVPLFTSDGGWPEALNSGALTMDGHLATANFGSDADTNFKHLREYNAKHNVEHPLMCMEFWDGWFNNWGKEIIRRDPHETAEEVRKVLKQGSINFYMFQGGTNFGFYNGNSDFDTVNIPQITSYDYDAPLTEWGAPTEKYFSIQKVIKEEVPEAQIAEPRYPELGVYDSVKVSQKTSLLSQLENYPSQHHDYTLPMEQLNQSLGYTLYETTLFGPREIEKFKIVDADDRVQIFVNGKHIATQHQTQIGENLSFRLDKKVNTLQILVENLGRNNYGPKIVSHSQNKGIRGGVMEDLHYIADWDHYSFEFDTLDWLNFDLDYDLKTPSFYYFDVQVDDPISTFIDTRSFGKGVIFVNGFNLGRYWDQGPTGYLYAPYPVWKKGNNQVIVFETEGIEIKELEFSERALYVDIQK